MFITYKPYMAQSASNNLQPQESTTNWRNNISATPRQILTTTLMNVNTMMPWLQNFWFSVIQPTSNLEKIQEDDEENSKATWYLTKKNKQTRAKKFWRFQNMDRDTFHWWQKASIEQSCQTFQHMDKDTFHWRQQASVEESCITN